VIHYNLNEIHYLHERLNYNQFNILLVNMATDQYILLHLAIKEMSAVMYIKKFSALKIIILATLVSITQLGHARAYG